MLTTPWLADISEYQELWAGNGALHVKVPYSHIHKASFLRLSYVTTSWVVEIYSFLVWRIIVQNEAVSRASLLVGHVGTFPVSPQF